MTIKNTFISSDKELVEALFNLRFNLTNKSQVIGKIASTGTFTLKNKPFLKTIFKEQLNNNLVKTSDNFMVNTFTGSDTIIIDADMDHDGLSNLNKGKEIFYKVSAILGEAIYLEFKKSGNFHAFFRFDRNITIDEKKLLEKELQKIHPRIEVHNKKNTGLRLPDNFKYSPINPLNINEKWSTDEWISYVNNYDSANSISLISNIIKLPTKKISSQVFKSTNKNSNKPSWLDTFEFECGQRCNAFFNEGKGFILTRYFGCEEEVAEYLLEHAGTSKDLTGPNANKVAEQMAKSAFNAFDNSKLGTKSIIKKSDTIQLDHLNLIDDNDMNNIISLSEAIFKSFEFSIRQSTKEWEKIVIKETLAFLLSYLDFQLTLESKVNYNSGLKRSTLDIIASSFAIHSDIIEQYIREKYSESKNKIKVSKVIRETLKILENNNIIYVTLEASSFTEYSYKKQYRSPFTSFLASIEDMIQMIFDKVKSEIKDKMENVLSTCSSSIYNIKKNKEYMSSHFYNIDINEKKKIEEIKEKIPKEQFRVQENIPKNSDLDNLLGLLDEI